MIYTQYMIIMSILTKIFGTLNDTFSIGLGSSDRVNIVNDAGVLKFSDKTRTNAIVGNQTDIDTLDLANRTWQKLFADDWIVTDGIQFTQPYNFSIAAIDITNAIIKYKSDLSTYSPGTVVTAGTTMILYPVSVPTITKIIFTKQ